MDANGSLGARALRNASFSLLGGFAGAAIGFFVAGFSIRVLGEGLSGLVLLVQSVLAVGNIALGLGLSTAALQVIASSHGSGNHEAVQEILAATSFVNITVGIFASVVFMGLAPWIFETSQLPETQRDVCIQSMHMYAIAFLLNFGTSTYQVIPSALQRYDYAASYTTITSLSNGLVQIAVLSLAPSIFNLAAGTLLVAVGQVLLSIWFGHRLLGKLRWPVWRPKIVLKMADFSAMVLGTQLGYMARDYVDKWLLNAFQGASALPGFMIGQTVMSRLRSFISGAVHFVFPMLSSISQSSTETRIFLLFDALHWSVSLGGTCLFSFIMLNGQWLLMSWVSPDFATKYAGLFVLASIQGILGVFTIVPHFSSLGLGKPINILLESIVSGALVVLLSLLLLPKLGVWGVAIAQLIAYSTSILILLLGVKRSIFRTVSMHEFLSSLYASLAIGACAIALTSFFSHSGFFADPTLHRMLLANALLLGAIVIVLLVERLAGGKSHRHEMLGRMLRTSLENLRMRRNAKHHHTAS